MKKIKRALSTRKGIQSLVAALLVLVVVAGAVAINANAAESKVTEITPTVNGVSYGVTNEYAKLDTGVAIDVAQDIIRYSTDRDFTDEDKRNISWTLSYPNGYSSDVVTFDGYQADTTATSVVHANAKPDDGTCDGNAPKLFYRHAGVVQLVAQPRTTVRYTTDSDPELTSEGLASRSIDIIAPLSVAYKSNGGTKSLSFQQDGNDGSYSLASSTQVDTDDVKWIGFLTNATIDNLVIKIDGTSQKITYKTEAEISSTYGSKDNLTSIVYNEDGVVYIPTSLFTNGAGRRTIEFSTADQDSLELTGVEKAFLKSTYYIDVLPKVDDTKIVHVAANTDGKWIIKSGTNAGENIGDVGGWCINDDDDKLYYIFSPTQLQEGNVTASLYDVTNIKHITDLKTSNTDDAVCDFTDGELTAKRVGTTDITALGYIETAISHNITYLKGIEATVVVPYTKIGNQADTVVMNVGDTYDIKTTGGNLQGQAKPTSTNNDYIEVGTGNVVTAKAKTPSNTADPNYEITVTTSINATTATFDSTQQAILKALYGGDAFSELTYKFRVIDGLSLNTDNLTVWTDDTVTLRINLTNDEKVTDEAGNEVLKYYPKITISNLVVNNTTNVQGITQGEVSYDKSEDVLNPDGTLDVKFHGVKVGYQFITVTQEIDGVTKKATCTIEVVQSLSSFYLDPATYTMYVGADNGLRGEQMFTARFTPNDADDKIIKDWFVTDDSIISVTAEEGSDTATVKALKGGVVYLYAVTENGAISEPAEITVRSPIDGITVEPSKQDCTTGQTVQLKTTVSHKDGQTYEDKIEYESSDPSLATVDKNGLVTCLKPGTVVINCRATDDFSIQNAWCTLTIETPVDSLTLSDSQVSLSVGEMFAIKGIITPGNATNQVVTWTVDDTSVATISYAENSTDSLNATITAVSPGWAFITCQTGNGIVATCRVQVKQPIEEITLNESEMTVRKGTVFWMNATYSPANADDNTITWSSSDESICTVDTSGKVTAVAVGQAYITASNTESAKFARCLITVIQSVDSLSLNANSVTLTIDPNYNIEPIMTSFGLVATVSPSDADNKRCTFVSTNPEIASVEVSEDGRTAIITAVKGGSTAVTVTTEDGGLVQTCTVTVMEYVTSIDITDDEKYVSIGKNAALKATVEAKSATNKNIIWTSSNDDVCYVDQTGVIHGISEGYAVITATAADGSGVADTCLVQVVNPATSMTIEPSSVHLLYGSSTSDSAVLTAVIEPEDATIKDVTWSSSNEAIATVDEGGEVFAMGVGNCTITATAADGSGIKATCKVRVTAAKNITSLKLNSKDIYMLVGKQRQLAVTVRPVAFTDTYDWYSTDTGIVTVNGSGLITTVGAGTADVVVESTENGVSSTCTVHSLGISRSTLRLEQYDSNDLDVLGIDSGDTVTWRSSNTRIATVDSSGHVVGRMSGTCTITAKTHDKTLTCTVTVFTAKKYN